MDKLKILFDNTSRTKTSSIPFFLQFNLKLIIQFGSSLNYLPKEFLSKYFLTSRPRIKTRQPG